MSSDIFSLELTETVTSAEEIVRLNTDAGKPCPSCGNSMTVGEDEASGICSDCYFQLIQEDNHG